MSDHPDTAMTFGQLRQHAIDRAQAASGKIWSDYNQHDPGVTLLEQTCFALSEIAFQSAHEIRDLLTGPTGKLDFPGLALFAPEQVLPTDPVTDLDLEALISDSDEVARAEVTQSDIPGLYDIVIVPKSNPRIATTLDQDEPARRRAREIFYRHRPLGCDLGKINVKKRCRVALNGEVQITATARPERVAAEVIYHVSGILRGEGGAGQIQQGATRNTVYKEPLAFQHALSEHSTSTSDLEDHLAILRAIPGVAHLHDLKLENLDEHPFDPSRDFRELDLPTSRQDLKLELTLNGVPLDLDPNQIFEEITRVAADHLSRAQHHLDHADWDVMLDGRHRDLSIAPVDSLLPMLYRTQGRRLLGQHIAAAEDNAPPREPARSATLESYRTCIDTHLAQMAASLSGLPDFFAMGTDADTADPPTHRQRIEVLDYLIALQGEEMPPTQHSALHKYRSMRQQQAFEISWRLSFLAALPELNTARATGPSFAGPGGFLAKLALLTDLPLAPTGLATIARSMGLQLDPRAEVPARRQVFRKELRPFSDIPLPPDRALPLDFVELLELSPWLPQESISPELLRRTVRPEAFSLVCSQGSDQFDVLFDTGDPEFLVQCCSRSDKGAASALLERIRTSWRMLIAAGRPGSQLAEMNRLGLSLDESARVPRPKVNRDTLRQPANPFDMLVRRDDAAEPLAGDDLLATAPWIHAGHTTPDLFLRSADPSAFVVAADSKNSTYQVLFDSGHSTFLYHCATLSELSDACDLANRIRAGWRAVHQACEGIHLVEDTLLRGPAHTSDGLSEDIPLSATLVLPGWAARSATDAYRTYVASLVARLAPANLYIRLLWLSDRAMRQFEELQAGVDCGDGVANARLRAFLHTQDMRKRLSNLATRLATVDPHPKPPRSFLFTRRAAPSGAEE